MARCCASYRQQGDACEGRLSAAEGRNTERQIPLQVPDAADRLDAVVEVLRNTQFTQRARLRPGRWHWPPKSTWVVDNACKGSASSRGLTSVTLAGVGHGVVIRGALMALVSPDQGIDSK